MGEIYAGKAYMCIKMLEYLNTGKLFKVSELAELLETNPRNIIEYKKELDCCGFDIVTVPGRYGGYRLDRSSCMPVLKMLPEEKASLIDLYNYAMTKKDFINKNGCTKTMAKIFSVLMIENDNPEGLISVDKINSRIEDSTIYSNYSIIEKAIKNKTALKIKYRWLKEPTSTITVDPYQLFLYDNEWRFFGWIEDKKDGSDPVCYFKLSRVESVEVTDKKFRVAKYFKPEKYLAKNVFTQNGEMFRLTLIAHGIRAKLIREKQYGYNQVCEDLPDGSVKVSMDMQKNPSTYNTILSFGDLVEVVEPQWLVDKIKDLALAIYKKYA